MAKVRRPPMPGGSLCSVCRVMTDHAEMQHVSAIDPGRKRGWVCDTCVARRRRLSDIRDGKIKTYYVTYPHQWGEGKVHRPECRHAVDGYVSHVWPTGLQACKACRPDLEMVAG